MSLLKIIKEIWQKFTGKKAVFAASLTLFALSGICAFRDRPMALIILVCALGYTGTVFALLIYGRKKMTFSAESPMLSGLTLDFVMSMSLPVVIVNYLGEIAWYNKAFLTTSGTKGTLYGKNIAEKINHSLVPARLFRTDSAPIYVPMNGIDYEVSCFKVTSSGKNYCITLWENKTNEIYLKKELKLRNTLVAFLVIDNFSEAMQFVQDKSRTASAVIGSEIDKWSASLGGIMKEYDKEKYVILFEERHLEDLKENKFEILDRVRNITIDGVVMQFTASIGIACVSGTLAEKEAASRVCLDLALQRGGDQAVLKNETSVEYYGGRSKSVQKKTKVRARVVANEICAAMRECSNVMVMGHKYADHDSIASCVAVSRLAKHMGKPVNIVVNIHDFNLKAIFNSLRGIKEYTSLFVDRESAQELMRSDTLLVVCDVNNPGLFEMPELYEAAGNFIVIDHHRKIGEFKNQPRLSHIEPAASSASELMSEILEQVTLPGTLPAVEANLLFAGIILDTKQFTKNTGVRTFGAALYLRSEGASPHEAQKLFRTNIHDFMRESVFENNIQIYRDSIAFSVYDGQADGRDRIAAAKAADRLLTVEGVTAAFVICVIDGVVNVSARSDGSINVQLVLEKLGGGGHFDAAGAQIKNTDVLSTLELLKKAIDEYLE